MWTLARPDAEQVARFLAGQRELTYSYPAVGATRHDAAPPGFAVDHNRQRLGRGDDVFARACAALRGWRMFPAGWTAIEPRAPIVAGAVVGVLVRTLGVWWWNAARIVYVLDEPGRFGFAYGTLPGHAESGEERFLVEQRADGEVWYDLRAFSRPRHWLARLGHPLTRALQRRFARASKAAMAAAAREAG
jgi:uncharacterized protein (UPF0548 family)